MIFGQLAKNDLHFDLDFVAPIKFHAFRLSSIVKLFNPNTIQFVDVCSSMYTTQFKSAFYERF